MKLNWYDLLDLFLNGPYERFSQDLPGGDLEAERLQIMGISLRQRQQSAQAATCLSKAIRLLSEAKERHGHASISLTLADAQVLLAQTALDQALDPGLREQTRRIHLDDAYEAVAQAKSHYEEWWASTSEPSHYEGRLNGTMSFLTAARSVLTPECLHADDWEQAESNARRSYEPSRYRKPFGIVAGKYAHAMLLAAKGRWYELRGDDPDGEVRMASYREGDRLLRAVQRDLLDAGGVTLGPAYERPKFEQALALLRTLLDPTKPNPPWDDPVTTHVLTPLL